jgi:hypothetical protein
VLLLVAGALGSCERQNFCKTVEARVLGNHPHTVSISADKIERGLGGNYRVHGDGHDHALTLRDEDMARLSRRESVTLRTSSMNAHLHEVTLRCAE